MILFWKAAVLHHVIGTPPPPPPPPPNRYTDHHQYHHFSAEPSVALYPSHHRFTCIMIMFPKKLMRVGLTHAREYGLAEKDSLSQRLGPGRSSVKHLCWLDISLPLGHPHHPGQKK